MTNFLPDFLALSSLLGITVLVLGASHVAIHMDLPARALAVSQSLYQWSRVNISIIIALAIALTIADNLA